MSIKNFLKIIAFASFLFFIMPVRSNAMKVNVASMSTAVPSDSINDSRIAAQIIQRVNEIQNMDKSNLTSDEKSALRKELRDMKHQASGLDKKVYLSIGAIIIIILVLILILK